MAEETQRVMPFDVPDKPTDETGTIEPRGRRKEKRDEGPLCPDCGFKHPDTAHAPKESSNTKEDLDAT